jgi:hypothetical protein
MKVYVMLYSDGSITLMYTQTLYCSYLGTKDSERYAGIKGNEAQTFFRRKMKSY